ncbi:hypothetical protein [Actinoplanes subtropicus]|uniref:hypothetical protein n=1 Tax=Actinoplanes subtropicus TaxID=543632 RepID=UPI0004C40D25|nr:hypothetical protein [Actinoplanes subtropicus]
MRVHHDGSELYVSSPGPALGQTVGVFVRVPAEVRASRIHLRRLSAGEPVFTSAVVDRTDRHGDVWWRAEIPARNPVPPYRFLVRESTGQTLLVLARRRPGEPVALTGLPGKTTWTNLYGGAQSLYTEADGSTVIDGYGPAFQVWAAE